MNTCNSELLEYRHDQHGVKDITVLKHFAHVRARLQSKASLTKLKGESTIFQEAP